MSILSYYIYGPPSTFKKQARGRGVLGGSDEPPLNFYSSERTPFEANELTPLKQTNPPLKQHQKKTSSVRKKFSFLKKTSSKFSFLKKVLSSEKKILFSKKKEPPLENLSYAPEKHSINHFFFYISYLFYAILQPLLTWNERSKNFLTFQEFLEIPRNSSLSKKIQILNV